MRKINELKLKQKENSIEIDRIVKKYSPIINYSYFSGRSFHELELSKNFFDLYNFKGVTSTNTKPAIENAYIEKNGTWLYKFPIYGFSVPINENPEDYNFGVPYFEYEVTVCNIDTYFDFPELLEKNVVKSSVITTLQNKDGSPAGESEYVILNETRDIQKLSVEFSEFYQWIKMDKGYKFRYRAIYPLIENEDLDISVKIYFKPEEYDYVSQSRKY